MSEAIGGRRGRRGRRAWLGALCAALLALATSAPAQGAFDDPLFVFTPLPTAPPNPPPAGYFQGPCGLAVDDVGNFYVSDYYHHAIDLFSPGAGYISQIFPVDPIDGPCGLALNASNDLYVNNYHRNVEKLSSPSPGVIDSSHPTGVAVDFDSGDVYVDARTYISAYDSTGAPLMDGSEPLKIGVGSLGDGYGLAASRFPATEGRLYVPDYSDNTVKVYDPAVDLDNPVQTITGPPGGFGSLRDSAVAVDRVTGEIYVADTLAFPQYTERPEATVYVFDALGIYKGRLKFNIIDASPPGLAVDNSTAATQGRVYVTSGNTIQASVYAYPPGAATSSSLPASFSLAVRSAGSGEGSVVTSIGGIDCKTACEEQIRSGAEVALTPLPEQGSAFAGWAGEDCQGTGRCTVEMSQARSVSAEFEALAGPPAPSAGPAPAASPSPARAPRAGASMITQKGKLRIVVSGRLAPRRLPRRGEVPVSVSVGGKITTTDGSSPPQLKLLRIEFNRGGRLESAGLPTCRYERIQPGSSSRALSACRGALVGRGSFSADITLSGQEPYPTRGRLLVFNGARKGKPVLFGHLYSRRPFATSFVLVFERRSIRRGRYGTALSASLPQALGNWGNLTGIEMTLSRRYSHRGRAHSFISAGCPAPKGFTQAIFPLARTSFAFAGGRKIDSVLTSTCKVRR